MWSTSTLSWFITVVPFVWRPLLTFTTIGSFDHVRTLRSVHSEKDAWPRRKHEHWGLTCSSRNTHGGCTTKRELIRTMSENTVFYLTIDRNIWIAFLSGWGQTELRRNELKLIRTKRYTIRSGQETSEETGNHHNMQSDGFSYKLCILNHHDCLFSSL